MTLPSHEYPIYDFTLPSTKEVVTFRPTLASERGLWLALCGSDSWQIRCKAIQRIIEVTSIDHIDALNLSVVDMEYVILKLLSISVCGRLVIPVQCNDHHDDIDDKHKRALHEAIVDLNNIKLGNFLEDRSIQLSPSQKVVMKYPIVEAYELVIKEDVSDEDKKELVANCLDYLVEDDEIIYRFADCSESEVYVWVKSLDGLNFNKLFEFARNCAHTLLPSEWDCPECGRHNVENFIGLEIIKGLSVDQFLE